MDEEKTEGKKEEHHHKKESENNITDSIKQISEKADVTKKIRENPWIISTFVLGIVVLIVLIGSTLGGVTGNAVSIDKAGENLVSYLNGVADSEVTLIGTEDSQNMYLITVGFKGDEIPVYVTKDGKYYTMSLSPITTSSSSGNSQQTNNVQKSDKPEVELYVFTYCPYGLQMEKAIIPAIKLLGDKIDFKIRQIGAMHGEYEKIEAERQLCVEKEYPDKFIDYILEFAEDTDIGSCKGDATCLTPKLNSLYAKLGIDASKINSCMSSDGENLYNAEVENAKSKGISGSPTMTINGVKTSSNRSPEAVKGVVCEAFNNVPSECSQTLSTSSASAGFGSGTTSSSSSASC